MTATATETTTTTTQAHIQNYLCTVCQMEKRKAGRWGGPNQRIKGNN